MKTIYWVAVIAGTILTPLLHQIATRQRGYIGAGGEFFIIPLFLLMALLVDQMLEIIMVVRNMQEKEKSQ